MLSENGETSLSLTPNFYDMRHELFAPRFI
jgi:hypothetical protein